MAKRTRQNGKDKRANKMNITSNIKYVAIIVVGLLVAWCVTTQAAELKRVTDQSVLFAGDFTENTAEQMKKYLVLNPQTTTVFLKSNGGLANEGFQLGLVFQKNSLNVIVAEGDMCMSACAFAFLGGAEKRIEGLLGFHNAHLASTVGVNVNDAFKQGQLTGGYTLYYAMDMGYNSQFVYLIQVLTDVETFIKFENMVDLNKFFVGRLIKGMDVELFLDPSMPELDDAWADKHVGKVGE